MINWPLVLFTTVALYALTILLLPFNAIYATIFLFAIISFWSRLPGVGIPHPLFILYNTDFVDLFALLLAVNLGPHWGITMVVFGNIWSRVCGVHPEWGAVVSDTLSLSTACLFMPFVHPMLGSDILYSMFAFTAIRWVFWQIYDVFVWPQVWANIWHKVALTLIGTPVIFIINGFYASVFGDFFDKLLEKGVQFNWILFFFVTAIITIFYVSVFGFSKSHSKAVKKTVRRVIKNRIKKKKEVGRSSENTELDDMRRIQNNI